MIYLNLDTGECRQNITIEDTLNNRYQIKGQKMELNKNSQKFVFITWLEAFHEILSRNNYTLEEKNSNMRIVPLENFNNLNQSSVGNDLEECPYILRTKYTINDLKVKVIKVIEIEMGKHNHKYSIYDTDNLFLPSGSSACENKTVYILSKPPLEFLNFLKGIENFQFFYQMVEGVINSFNEYTDFPLEFCNISTLLHKYDLTLKNIREYLKSNNLLICGDDCEFEGGNLATLEFRCNCPLKKITEQMIYLEDFINYKVLTCFKLNFSLYGQKNNYFSMVYIYLFMLDIFFIIINEMNLEENLNKMIKYCKEYILKNNSNDDNAKNKQFKKLRFIHLNKLTDDELKKNFDKFISQKIINNPIKKKRNKKQKRNKKLEIKIAKLEETGGNLRQVEREEIENNSYDYYYLYLIYVYKKKDRKTFLIEEELNDLDFNLYKNIESRSIFEIYWSIFKTENDFISTFFIFNTTSNYYKEYRFYIIKIIIYISSLTFSIIINILFYKDETMNKLVEDDNKYILSYNLPRIIYLVLIMKIFFKISKNLFDFQDEFINLKKNLDVIDQENIECNNSKNINIINSNIQTISDNVRNNSFSKKSLRSDRKLILNPIEQNRMKRSVNIFDERKKNKIKIIHNTTDNQIESTNDNIKNNKKEETKEEMSRSIENSFRRNRIIFYVIILIFKIFSWYCISCFCAVYNNTQKHLAFDIIYIMIIDFISCFFTSFYILIIRIFIKRRCCIKIFNYNFF